MARIKRIVVHCTGEPAEAVRNIEYYRHYFFDVLKWKHYGYHAVVYQDGSYDILQKWPRPSASGAVITNETMANGAKGYNHDSLHIAYVGGLFGFTKVTTDTRTRQQKSTLRHLISKWKKDYNVANVVGHRDLPGVSKACPCFDAIKEYRDA